METDYRKRLKTKKRIVIKVGSSTLTHPETGDLHLAKIEKLVRMICDLKGQGKDVILVSSGAIAAGRQALGHRKRPDTLAEKQAFAAVGQARLMMVYQRMFSEYNHTAAQVLLTKHTMLSDSSRYNAQNTFEELLKLGAVPVVNENDTVGADLLILLSDIDGLYSDDPKLHPNAKFISLVTEIDTDLLAMGKATSSSDVGTGGMSAKLSAARIATDSGTDLVIANGADLGIIQQIMDGEEKGTLFLAHPNKDFDLMDYLSGMN